MIHARRLGLRVGERWLLHGVDAEVTPGRVTAVVGPNGAGKSTLLRLLSGELRPSAGAVYLDGRPLDGWTPRKVALRRAVMGQHATLEFPFSALEVVLVGRTPHIRGREGPHDLRAARDALDHASAGHLEARRYPTLSGGERQRVDYARALVQVWEDVGVGSRFLLLDEPTSSLDLARQHELLASLRAVRRDDVGVLVVLHDLNLAARYADHLIVLRDGRLLASGAPRNVLTANLVAEAFELPVVVMPHPCHDCPLVVPAPRGEVEGVA
jgi:iron complex transport system ATP-binding protein